MISPSERPTRCTQIGEVFKKMHCCLRCRQNSLTKICKETNIYLVSRDINYIHVREKLRKNSCHALS